MDIEHTLLGSLRARIAGQNIMASTASPDWRGLHGRFAAEHAARLARLAAASRGLGPRGSFDTLAAATIGDAGRVNLDDSTDGKDRSPISPVNAGIGKHGGKGYV